MIFILILVSLGLNCNAQHELPALETYEQIIPVSKVMILGTYHFHQEEHYDECDSINQIEITRLVQAMSSFQPTKIVIEKEPKYHDTYNRRFQDYKKGTLNIDTLSNEIYQIGFRFAKLMQHDSIFLFDNQTEFIGSLEGFSFDRFFEYADEKDKGFYNRYEEELEIIYKKFQNTLSEQSLYDHLMLLNSPRADQLQAQRMHLYELRVGIQDNWIGADWLGRWYQRNLRMMANIIKYNQAGKDRILIIVGSNHKWILKQLFEFSPEFEVVSSFESLVKGR